MSKQDVIEFFNERAPKWDAEMIRHDITIHSILNYARVRPGMDILDVACGTGVLIPDYLKRKVASVTAVDIAPEMVKIAKEKFKEENVNILCGDIEELELEQKFDCIVVYNAFPHFSDPVKLIRTLITHLKPGGVLTIAHGMSREKIDRRHAGSAKKVSHGLMSEDELAMLFEPNLDVIVKISNSHMYQVSGVLSRSYAS